MKPHSQGKDAGTDFALAYAEKGWAILPLFPPNPDGTCTCKNLSCHSPGKHPLSELVPNGQHGASSDLSTIQQWYALWPDANIGIALAPSELVVVAPDSEQWLKEFE